MLTFHAPDALSGPGMTELQDDADGPGGEIGAESLLEEVAGVVFDIGLDTADLDTAHQLVSHKLLLSELDFLLDLPVIGVIPLGLDAGAGVEIEDRLDEQAEVLPDVLIIAGAEVPAEDAEGRPFRGAGEILEAECAVVLLDIHLVAADLEGLVLEAEIQIEVGLPAPGMEVGIDDAEGEIKPPGLPHRAVGIVLDAARETDAETRTDGEVDRTIRFAASRNGLLFAEERQGEIKALGETLPRADNSIGAGLDGGGEVVVGVLLGAEDFDLLALR